METTPGRNYFALILLLIPVLTIFGNLLVVLAIIRERSLRSITNYFIFSLAVADFFVALAVMPFAVYIEVERLEWNLGVDACNVYIALDVCASTASILNLMAISLDRYAAIARPIEYSCNGQRNRRRAFITIFLVWFLSAVIALPIMLGVNDPSVIPGGRSNTSATNLTVTVLSKDEDDSVPHSCEFQNAVFMIGSSLGSFYIPCVVMVVLYSFILKRLHERRRSQRQKRQPKPTAVNYVSKDGRLLPNRPFFGRKKKLDAPEERKGLTHALNLLGAAKLATDIGKRLEASAEETTLNTTTPSSSEEDLHSASSTAVTCNSPQNRKPPPRRTPPRRSASCSQEPLLQYAHSLPSIIDAPRQLQADNSTATGQQSSKSCNILAAFGCDLDMIPFIDMSRPGSMKTDQGTSKQPIKQPERIAKNIVGLRPRGRIHSTADCTHASSPIPTILLPMNQVEEEPDDLHLPTIVTRYPSCTNNLMHNNTQNNNKHFSRTNIADWCSRLLNAVRCSRVAGGGRQRGGAMGHTARRQIKREQKHIRKETKATQTLAVVLAVFLICWTPFFTVHLYNSLCMVIGGGGECVDFIYFFLTTWLGYMNSFMNPIIYTIFNPEYRKAFRRILSCQKAAR